VASKNLKSVIEKCPGWQPINGVSVQEKRGGWNLKKGDNVIEKSRGWDPKNFLSVQAD
jgi:hypothetical protein